MNFGDSNKPDLKQFSLEKGKSIVIGRTDCDININKQTISKKHALIEVHDGVYFLQDLESSNKTKIYQNKDTKEYYSLKPKRYYQILPNNKLKFGDVEAIFLAHTKEVKEIEKVQKIEEKPKEIIEENIESLSKESSPPTKKVFFEEATQNYQNSYDEEKKQNNIFENTQNYHVFQLNLIFRILMKKQLKITVILIHLHLFHQRNKIYFLMMNQLKIMVN